VAIYIGIDGGGTTTRLLVQQDEGVPEYSEHSVSIKVQDGDFAGSAQRFRNIIAEVSTKFGSFSSFRSFEKTGNDLKDVKDTIKNFASITIGLSGMSREEHQNALKTAILAFPEFESAKIHIESDATLTLKAVLPEGEEGILLIAGTGSVIFYQALGQPARRIGGWGPPLSDEGSGYRIGLNALRQYIWMLDSVDSPDALTERIRQRLIERGLKNPEDRTELSRIAREDTSFVASLARDTLEEALKPGDDASDIRDLVREELGDLFTMLFPIFSKGIMSGYPPYKLFLAGSIARHRLTLDELQKSFEPSLITPILVAESAPAMKALEIAKTL
jgi:N-acetylglucosamine kinase-like BadF-type ATPase